MTSFTKSPVLCPCTNAEKVPNTLSTEAPSVIFINPGFTDTDTDSSSCKSDTDTVVDVECPYKPNIVVLNPLNIDLIILTIFSYADFQTLKTCRLVQKSWKNSANFEIHRRGGSRTFIHPANLGQMVNTAKKKDADLSLLKMSDFVLEKITNSRIYWTKLYSFFVLLGGSNPRVTSLTIIWPPGIYQEEEQSPPGHVIQRFLQILQQLSASLKELNVTHYLMANEPGRGTKKVMDSLQLKLTSCTHIKILPRFPCDARFINIRRGLSSQSVGLFIVQSCPLLERVDNFHLEDPLEWPRYVHLVKNYVYHQPLRLNKNFTRISEFSRAIWTGFPLESLSDSCYNFPYNPSSWISEAYRVNAEAGIQPFLRILKMSQNSLKLLKLRDFPFFNFPLLDRGILPLTNLQKLQLKIGKDRNIQHFFNPGKTGRFHNDPLPSLKTLSLALETGWQNWMTLENSNSDRDPKIVYRSVTNLELCPECLVEGKLMGERAGEQKLPLPWLEMLQKLFPNIQNVIILDAINLQSFILAFLGPKSKFSIRSFSFNIRLGAYARNARYPNLDPVLRKLVSTPQSVHGLIGLQKLDVIFEDYWRDDYFWAPALISASVLREFLQPLTDLQVTFYYDHNQSPKDLMDWLRPLASASPRVRFQHLRRDPIARSVELEMYNVPIKTKREKDYKCIKKFLFCILMGVVFLLYIISNKNQGKPGKKLVNPYLEP